MNECLGSAQKRDSGFIWWRSDLKVPLVTPTTRATCDIHVHRHGNSVEIKNIIPARRTKCGSAVVGLYRVYDPDIDSSVAIALLSVSARYCAFIKYGTRHTSCALYHAIAVRK